MNVFLAAIFALFVSSTHALAWGQEGHSIVAEIAQHRLSGEATARVDALLGTRRSLASVASWPDDVRDRRPESYNWHFVDMPLMADRYVEKRDCKEDAKGDCTIKELGRAKRDLVCAGTDELKAEALKFVVHFVGDIHQPLHTLGEESGGNKFQVDMFMRGMTCLGTCKPVRTTINLHEAWDSGLILKTVWDWGAYVDRLENGWLKAPPANADAGSPTDWVEQTHQAARIVWNLVPADFTLNDEYYNRVLPILDQQLALGGLRLAKFLNDAFAASTCP
jgi:hypothetical protein